MKRTNQLRRKEHDPTRERSKGRYNATTVLYSYLHGGPIGVSTPKRFTKEATALVSSEKISDFGIVALSFVCDKYYPIMY